MVKTSQRLFGDQGVFTELPLCVIAFPCSTCTTLLLTALSLSAKIFNLRSWCTQCADCVQKTFFTHEYMNKNDTNYDMQCVLDIHIPNILHGCNIKFDNTIFLAVV